MSIDALSKLIKGKLGKGVIDVRNDGSFHEYIDFEETIGYWYDKSQGKYVPTKRCQVKYALGDGNIHIIPVKEK